jgi:hypothetical protein
VTIQQPSKPDIEALHAKVGAALDARYLKCVEEMRDEATKIAMSIARLEHCHPGIPAALDTHVYVMLQAIAAEHMAYGREVLAKHYLASALRVEAGV